MKAKDLEYHKKELHNITEHINQLRKSLGMVKRISEEQIFSKLLKHYEYWASKPRSGKNIGRIKYARKKVKTFYKLMLNKIFHQSAIVILMDLQKRRSK